MISAVIEEVGNTLGPCYSKYGTQTSGIDVATELVRNALSYLVSELWNQCLYLKREALEAGSS